MVTPGRYINLLEIGTAVLFGALMVYAFAKDVRWSIVAARVRVDARLMLIVLASISLRQSFTLQYARETIGRGHWDSADFVHNNRVISAISFGPLVLADIVMAYVPAVPNSTGGIATAVTFFAAVKFPSRYPGRRARTRT
ncbi:hypothetical protein [Paraburkholderia sp. 2C]